MRTGELFLPAQAPRPDWNRRGFARRGSGRVRMSEHPPAGGPS